MTCRTMCNVEMRTVGDSRGYLWRIIIDRRRGIGKLEKISGINDGTSDKVKRDVNGKVFQLGPDSDLHDDMKDLTDTIESRFEAA